MKSIRMTAFAAILLLAVTAVSAVGWVRYPDVTGLPTGRPVKGGGGIVTVGDDVYLVPGNNTLDFMRFSSGAWAPIIPGVPEGPKKKKVKKGGWLVSDAGKIYLFKGGGTDEFYVYDTGANTWTPLNGPGFSRGVRSGFAAVVDLGGAKYIYAGSGTNSSEWERFDLTSLTWGPAAPTALPVERAKFGSALVTDGAGLLYFLAGSGGTSNQFYMTDLNQPTPAWTARLSLPLTKPISNPKKKVKEGGCIENLNGVFYAVKGGSTREFWAYLPSSDLWVYLGEVGSSVKKGIKCGKSLAVSAAGVYCIIGNNLPEFQYYNPVFKADKGINPAEMSGGTVPRATTALTPNLVRHGTDVACSLPVNGTASVKISNSMGQVVLTLTATNGHFPVPDLAPGVYSLSISAPGYSGHEKLTVLE